MGRAFEYRKARKLKRWGNMARTFTKIGKEIEIAVKAGGPDPSGNVRLRILMQNAKAENMPKENVERAIKRAISKDTSDYREVIYEGYGPHGIAFLVETATDNTNRTVASMRMYFNKCGGALGTSGSVAFMFEHKCSFKFHVPAGTDFEELELNMIDTGVDDFCPEDETTVTVEAPYEQFGTIQKWLEDNGYEIVSGESLRIPTDVRPYGDDPFAWCIRCGACIRRCPGHAIGKEFADRDKPGCARYCVENISPEREKNYGWLDRAIGCALCQTGVPCEFQRPGRNG